ncbi:MAG: flagellar filament capping protein FliD [Peptococcaceae bacterium]|jgi:flagellar hook-associated protein 2|nr:flagellar filament capping protein FliD [Peptococcaceae bacterium]
MSIGSTNTVSNSGGLIQFSGLAGGLNTSAIINALVQFASQPITLLQNEVTQDQAKAAAWTDIGTQLSGLGTAVTNLQLQANMTGMTAASSDTAVATATANPNALAGSYSLVVSQTATATTVDSAAQLSAPVSQTAYLDSAGFAVTPTAGYFTINGKQINVDPSTQSLTDIVNAINTSGAGVTAQIDPSNSDLMQLVGSSPMQVGSSSDTSNFLSATNLLGAAQVYNGTDYVATSTSPMAKINPSAVLNNDSFATALTQTTSGQFSINGVNISYNTATDTLNSIIDRINNANAGVSASYNSLTDQVDLTATATGAQSVNLSDVSGNLLAALQLTNATQNTGQNAVFTVNGGSTINSASNQVTNAIGNVTLNLAGTGNTTLTVGADTQSAMNTINAFVSAYNTANADMNGYLAQGKTLQGDQDLQNLQQTMFNDTFAQVPGQPAGYGSLAQIGITSDQNTGNLVVDTSTLQAALAANPQAVYSLFNNSAAGVATTLNNFVNSYTTPGTGQIALEEQGYNNDITNLNQNITSMQQGISLYQQQLQQEFTAMEKTIEGLQSTSGYLSSMLTSLGASSSTGGTSSSSTTTGG